MYIVLVHAHVKPDSVREFIAASLENARQSNREPGIARFDVIQETEDPTRFILVEAYRTAEDSNKHKETPHYLRWRELVADMMAEPRKGVFYNILYAENLT